MTSRSLLPAFLGLSACIDHTLSTFKSPPSAVITSHADGDVVMEGEPVQLRGVVEDTDDPASALIATWYLGDTILCDAAAPGSSGDTTCDVVLDAGDADITLEVRDPNDAAATDSVTLTVQATEAPIVTLVDPTEDGVYYSDRLVVLEATVADGEDAPEDLVVTWESSLDGVLPVSVTPDSDGSVVGAASLSLGQHFLTVRVEDTDGKTATDSVIVDVGPPNTAPSCAITAPADGSLGNPGETVLFTATATDPDVPADWLQVEWASDHDGTLGTSTPDSSGDVSFAYADLTAGTHTVRVTVTDEVGATCTDSILYTVGTPPEITLETPVDGDVYAEDAAIRFSALVSDDEDRPEDLTLAWTSDLDGTFSTQGADSSGTAAFSDSLSVGEHTLTVVVTDTDGSYTSTYATVTVNGAPSAPGVTLSPDPATDADTLTASLVPSVDPEGDTVSYTYAWYVDGVLSGASTSATLPASATARGDTWTVEVTPDDGLNVGPAGTASITIGNAAPSVSAVTITPDPAVATDSFACAWTFADADGDADASTAAWTIDGVASGTGTTLGALARKGQTVTCTVTPYDSFDAGAPASASVVVGNTPPVVTDVTIAPDPAYAGDTLTASVTTSDVDADSVSVTYAWTIDGAAAGTGATLSSSALVRSAVVTVTATPDDGDDTGTAATATLTIGNTAPGAPSVGITPAAPDTDDDLRCEVVTAASDPDGDALTYAFAWTVDGAAWSGTTDTATSSTVPASATHAGEAWTCSATASDGLEVGPVGTASVTVVNSAPSVAAVAVTPDPATTTDSFACAWSFSDADGDADASSVDWTIDGVAAGTGATLGAIAQKGETVTCTVTPDDGMDTGAPMSDSVVVGDTPPVVTAVTLSPDPAYEGDTLTASATTTDVDGDPVTVTYTWTIDGVSSGSGTTLASASLVRGAVVVVTATPNDGDDAGTPATATLTIGNTAPSSPAIALTPATPDTTDDLLCEVTTAGTDPDGDALTYTFAWAVDGVAWTGTATATATSSTVPASATSAGDAWTCSVASSDGLATSAAVSASVTIENLAPTATVTLSPDPADTDDTLTASVTTSDPDGDPVSLTYAWEVNGVAVAETGATLAGSWFDRDDTVSVTVTPDDGQVSGTAVSDSLVIDNSAPSTPVVAITPASPADDDDLLCAVTTVSSDADGDAITYTFAWTVDGVAYTGTTTDTATSSTVPASATSSSEDWVCTVTPDDGTDDGTAGSDSVTTSSGGPWVYIAEYGNNRVWRVDVGADTLELLFTDSRLGTPRGLALDDDGYLYAAQQQASGGTVRGVARFTTDGTFVDQFLAGPYGSYGPGLIRYHDGELLVTGDTAGSGSTYRYDIDTGALISSFHYSGTTSVMGLYAEGNYVWVTGYFANNIVRYDISTTTASSSRISTALSTRSWGITRGHTGNFFVTDADSTGLCEYNATTGALVRTFHTFAYGQSDIWYDDVSDTYFVTSHYTLYQLDTSGNVINSWTDPSMATLTGIAVTYTEW